MTTRLTEPAAESAGQSDLARRLALLEAVTAALGEDLDLAGLLDRLLASVREVTGVGGGGIFLFDERSGGLKLTVHQGISDRLAESFVTNPGERLHRMALDPNATLIVQDLSDPSGYRSLIAEEGVRAYAAIPLRARGQPLGVLAVVSTSQSDFSAADVELLQSIGRQIGLAVERARLYKTAQHSLRRAEAFQEIVAAISESLDPAVTLERVLDAAIDVFEADRGALFLLDGRRRVTCPTARNLSQGYLDAVLAVYNGSAWPQVLNEQLSVYVEDAQAGHIAPALSEAIRREGFRSILFLPMPDGADRLGAIVLYHDRIRRYNPQEIDLGRSFAAQASIAIRHARLFAAERRAREQAATILEATRAVTSSLQEEEVLREAGRAIAAAFGQTVCGIWFLNEERTALVPAFRVTPRPDPERDAIFRAIPPVPLSDNPRVIDLLQGRSALIVDDDHMGAAERVVQRRLPFDGYVAIPIAARDRVVGAATVSLPARDLPIRREDIDVAMAIARSTALAVDNARLHEQSQQLAASEERNRLARELHDSVTHSLFSMTLIGQALPILLERDQDRARERIDRLNELGRGALAEMRALLFQLRPAALQEQGLIVALTHYTKAFESREGVAVQFTVEGDQRLPVDVEEAVFRVAQEALNNVAKHARATRVEVRLATTVERVTLTVRDDGAGFDLATLPSERQGLGMTGMHERAALLGGVCAIESAPDRGTMVSLTVPLCDES